MNFKLGNIFICYDYSQYNDASSICLLVHNNIINNMVEMYDPKYKIYCEYKKYLINRAKELFEK